jgi:hypothetical protein
MRFFPSERFPLLRKSKELAFFLVTEGIFVFFHESLPGVPRNGYRLSSLLALTCRDGCQDMIICGRGK